MKKLLVLFLCLSLFYGFYSGLLKLDPVTIVLLSLVLWNNREFSLKQEQLAFVVKKAHEVSAANEREIMKRIENIRSDIRTRRLQ